MPRNISHYPPLRRFLWGVVAWLDYVGPEQYRDDIAPRVTAVRQLYTKPHPHFMESPNGR